MAPKIPAHVREQQINELPNIRFVRWVDGYRDNTSKAVFRCSVDGFEWAAKAYSVLNNGRGCPNCAGNRRWTESERVEQINALPNINFIRWVDGYRNAHSKALCRCSVDGSEWASQVRNLLNIGSGCPSCAGRGFNTSKHGTLYALRSECGTMVKIGISNDYERRHRELARDTPFGWNCIELIHGCGASVAFAEKEIHALTEPVLFPEPFEGYTEWRKWDDRIPLWLEHFRRNIEAQ